MVDTKTAPKPASKTAKPAKGDYPTPQGPKFVVYAVRDRDGARAVWTRIGAAFEHKGFEAYNIMLDALPVDRKIVLMPPKEPDETA